MSVFEVISKIEDIEVIAVGGKIRDLEWLRKNYGSGRWLKLKGFARVRFLDDSKNLMPNYIGMKRAASAKWK